MKWFGARPYERTTFRKDHGNGMCTRTLRTRVGEIDLTVPRLRTIPFQSQNIAQYQKMEILLEKTLIEIYLRSISTRKITDITEELCWCVKSTTPLEGVA